MDVVKSCVVLRIYEVTHSKWRVIMAIKCDYRGTALANTRGL